jgi:hypothetical protein
VRAPVVVRSRTGKSGWETTPAFARNSSITLRLYARNSSSVGIAASLSQPLLLRIARIYLY